MAADPNAEAAGIDPIRVLNPIRDKIRQGKNHRQRFEPTWESNLAWARGDHWHVWDRDARTMRRIQDVDPRYANRELYTVDLITEYRTTILGELGSDDDQPSLLLSQDSPAAEAIQKQVNKALGYAWNYEINADAVISETDRMMVDMGTAAIRCRFDNTLGPPAGELPYYNNQPMVGDMATQMMGQYEGGPVPGVEMRSVNKGKIVWEPLSPFNLIVPPGVTHEMYFPWECVVRPVPLAEIAAQFGEAAEGLQEDKNIGSTMGQVSMSGEGGVRHSLGEGRDSRLRDHAWLYTFYQRATPQEPQGSIYHFAGQEMRFLDRTPNLPYAKLDFDGQPVEYCSGITYFHYWRVTGSFWGRSLVENLKETNRAYDKRRTQVNELLDRGMPTVFVQEGSEAIRRTDIPLEIVELGAMERPPTIHQGIGPGPWMKEEVELLENDMERASGVRAPSLGENPSNVITVGQLTLIKESDQVKRQPTMIGRKQSIAELTKYTVYDIRNYWGREKQIAIAGENDLVEATTFDSSRIPPFFIVKVSKGSAKPRSQGAELTKIEQIFQGALATGAASVAPTAWMDWYYESLESGSALELPAAGEDIQIQKAEIENHKMMEGELMPVAYSDLIEAHLPIHRRAQIEAEMAGEMQPYYLIERHIQQHLQAVQLNVESQVAALDTGGDLAAEEAPEGTEPG